MKRIEYNSQIQPLTGEELNAIGGGNLYEGFRYLARAVQTAIGVLKNTPELPPATIYK